MGKDRTKIISGVSDIVVASGRILAGDGEPTFTPGEVGGFPMIHAGFPADEKVVVKTTPSSIKEIGGGEIQQADIFEARASGLETHPTHLALLENFARLPNRTFWYLRKLFPQIGETEAIKIGDLGTLLEVDQHLHTKGTSLVSLIGQKYSDAIGGYDAGDESPRMDLVTTDAHYAASLKKYVDLVRSTRRQNLVLSLAPDITGIGLHVAGQTSIYDESDNRYIGTLNNGPTWTSPYLRFDGVNDDVTFGDILDDDGVSDLLIEAWIRIQAANGTTVRILGKKSNATDNTAGWAFYRHAGNAPVFCLGSGAASVSVGATALLQNVWGHFAVSIDRNGNAQAYLNAAASGAPASVAAIASGTNAFNLRVGRDEAVFGQVDIGRVRVYNFGAGGLPASIASIIAAHFNSSKSIYGL